MSSIAIDRTTSSSASATPLAVLALRAGAEALFWLVVIQLVTGLYLQSQLALFDGRIALSNGIPKLLLVGLVVAAAAFGCAMRGGQVVISRYTIPACVLACYLVADLAWLVVMSGLPKTVILTGLNKYFLFYAALPAAALVRPLLPEQVVRRRFALLLIPLAGLALAQYALNDSLLPTTSEDGTYEIPAIDFYGQTRAFSLFRSVLECGQGMAFFGALFLAQVLVSPRHRIWNGVLLALAAAGCYATFRRGAYMEFGAAAIATTAIARRWRITPYLPWLYLACGIAVASGGTLLTAVGAEGILSWESLAERHEAWTTVLDRWLLREDASLFLGTGLAQIELDDVEYFLVDNGFLAVGAELGLVGLALWCWVMHTLWKEMLATAWRTNSGLATAVAALIGTWMMRAMFDPLFSLYPLYAFLVYWTITDSPAVQGASSHAGQQISRANSPGSERIPAARNAISHQRAPQVARN